MLVNDTAHFRHHFLIEFIAKRGHKHKARF